MVLSQADVAFNAQKVLLDETSKMGRRWLVWPDVVRRAARTEVGTTPHDVVQEVGSQRLLRYRPAEMAYREPVLICYALVNRPYILDLRPERSVVRRLLERGLTVYLLDWGAPMPAEHVLGLRDYVCDRLVGVVDFVRREAGVPSLHLLGYCMGGTMAALFTALYPEKVRALTLMAGPIDFSSDEGLLYLWSREKYFDVDRLIDAFGNFPGELLQEAFRMMSPVRNYLEKYISFWENIHDEDFLDSFFAMERWGADDVPVAGETFREFVKCLYQRNELVRGELRLGGRPVKLENIVCPLLLLTASLDHLVPPASTLGIVPHVRSTEITTMSVRAGHVGLAVSSKAHRELWPAVRDWIADRSTKSSPGVRAGGPNFARPPE